MLSETAEDRELRILVEWIERRGGSSTVREVQQGHRQYVTSTDAENALNKLKVAGFGNWHPVSPSPSGGRPTESFRLEAFASTQLAETLEPEGFVDVDSEKTPNASSDEDWGEL
jgi:hypothetical protein